MSSAVDKTKTWKYRLDWDICILGPIAVALVPLTILFLVNKLPSYLLPIALAGFLVVFVLAAPITYIQIAYRRRIDEQVNAEVAEEITRQLEK